MKKLVDYLPFVALFILPLLLYPVVDRSGWISSSDIHASLEFASSFLAVTAGLMILLHFFAAGRLFYLIFSMGFVLIGTEEFVHAIFSLNRIRTEIPPTFKFAISSTWLTGRFGLLFVAQPEGVAEMRLVPPDESVDRVIQRADEAMYAAKQTGRNRTVIFDPDRIGAI